MPFLWLFVVTGVFFVVMAVLVGRGILKANNGSQNKTFPTIFFALLAVMNFVMAGWITIDWLRLPEGFGQ